MLVYLGLVILEVCKELFKCVFFIDRNFATKIYLRLPIQDYVFSNIYILIQNKLTYKFLYDFLNEYAYILLIHLSNVRNSQHNIGRKITYSYHVIDAITPKCWSVQHTYDAEINKLLIVGIQIDFND